MASAPVLITTCNRVRHLERSINSLMKCHDAQYTDVYIALDYPPNDTYRGGYNEVVAFLDVIDAKVFHTFTVIKRGYNHGPFENTNELRHMIMEKYEYFISLPDDVEVGPNFLLYMNSALEKYKDDENVIIVSGYSYPLEWKAEKGTNTLKVNYVAAEWGIGFWSKKYKEIESVFLHDFLYNEFLHAYKTGKMEIMTDACLKDYSVSILNLYSEDSLLRRICDVSLRIYLAVADKYAIMPVLSHSINHGFDGSGVFCPEINYTENEAKPVKYADNYDYDNQDINIENGYRMIISGNDYWVENKRMLDCFDRRDKIEMTSIRRRLGHYAIVGKENYHIYLVAKTYFKAATRKMTRIIKRA